MKTIRLKPGKERSLQRRHPWVFDGAGQYPCVVLDVSEAGMKLDLLGREPEGDSFSVFLSAQEPMALVRIQWRDGSVVGVQMA